MRKLVLKQGLSYAAKGISCKKEIPFDVNDEMAERLLATGRFEEQCSMAGVEDNSAEEVQALSADDIADLKKPELEALAVEHNIDISDCRNNDERIERICGVLGLASLTKMGLEE